MKAKKDNPYLAHRVKPEVVVVPHTGADAVVAEEVKPTGPLTLDPRLKGGSSRDQRGKKSFHFVEEGTYVKEADKIRHKEERKVIAGYSSGRKRPDQEEGDKGKGPDDNNHEEEGDDEEDDEEMLNIYGRGAGSKGGGAQDKGDGEKHVNVPPPADGGVVPVMEIVAQEM
mgnify:FL=1